MVRVEKLARGGERVLDFLVKVGIMVSLFFISYSIYSSYKLYRGASLSDDILKYKPRGIGDMSLAELMALNPDVIGWVILDGTKIDYPVVQGKDNFVYLNKDCLGEFSFSGSIFLDSENDRDFGDVYSLLHGHHMEKRAMFGDLELYAEEDFFKENRTGTLYAADKMYDIEIFAYLETSAYDAQVFRPADVEDREAFVADLRGKAEHFIDPDFEEDDRVIGFGTCSSAATDGRTMIFGRLREAGVNDKK